MKFLKSNKSKNFNLNEDSYDELSSNLTLITDYEIILSHREIVDCINSISISQFPYVTEEIFNKKLMELNSKKQREIQLLSRLETPSSETVEEPISRNKKKI